MQSEYCKVLEFLPAENEFLVLAGVGWKAGVTGFARAGADRDSPAGFAFQTGRPVISNHLELENRFRTPALLVEHGVRRAVNVLIQGEGDRFGVLEVDNSNPDRFTEADLAFLQGFANLLGIAVERQRAEEALLQESLRHKQILTREISHRVKNSLAIVAGLLAMQRRMYDDPRLSRAPLP